MTAATYAPLSRPRRWTCTTPARARRAVRTILTGTDDTAVEDIVLAVSELVTNAIIHGSPPVRCTLRLVASSTRKAVVFEVSDTQPLLQKATRKRPDYGRGIAIVRAVTTELGVQQTKNGKTVWFIKEIS